MVLHELPIINLAPKLTAVVAWIFVFEKNARNRCIKGSLSSQEDCFQRACIHTPQL